MIVAFDFDDVLENYMIQQLVIKFKIIKSEVWIVTARSENDYNKNILKPVIDKVHVGFSNVIFCGNKSKVEMLKMLNADIYIDNITDEFEEIINNTNTIPLQCHNN